MPCTSSEYRHKSAFLHILEHMMSLALSTTINRLSCDVSSPEYYHESDIIWCLKPWVLPWIGHHMMSQALSTSMNRPLYDVSSSEYCHESDIIWCLYPWVLPWIGHHMMSQALSTSMNRPSYDVSSPEYCHESDIIWCLKPWVLPRIGHHLMSLALCATINLPGLKIACSKSNMNVDRHDPRQLPNTRDLPTPLGSIFRLSFSWEIRWGWVGGRAILRSPSTTGRIQRKTWCIGPYDGVGYNLTYMSAS
jgi:hypothetical protein